MKVEREISGVALPFAAGVVLSVWSGHLLCTRPYISAGLICSFIITSVAFLLFSYRKPVSSDILKIAMCTGLVSCGSLCVLTSELLSISHPGTDRILDAIESLGTATGEMIDGIGFSNRDTNAIIKALIIGDRSDIPAHITEAFRSSGASHILALSGLHLGIIHYICSRILSIIGNSPQAQSIRSVSTVLLCGLYTLATGAGASIVRAFLFIMLNERARISKSPNSLGATLMSALIIHLTISPGAIKEVGFQLSYAAIAGIAYIYPRLRSFWPDSGKEKEGLPVRIWESAALSISCQFTTGPLAYLYFGTFPTHFLLTNLIALPLTGLIVPASLLTIVLEAFGICPEIIRKAAEALVSALSAALDIISQM